MVPGAFLKLFFAMIFCLAVGVMSYPIIDLRRFQKVQDEKSVKRNFRLDFQHPVADDALNVIAAGYSTTQATITATPSTAVYSTASTSTTTATTTAAAPATTLYSIATIGTAGPPPRIDVPLNNSDYVWILSSAKPFYSTANPDGSASFVDPYSGLTAKLVNLGKATIAQAVQNAGGMVNFGTHHYYRMLTWYPEVQSLFGVDSPDGLLTPALMENCRSTLADVVNLINAMGTAPAANDPATEVMAGQFTDLINAYAANKAIRLRTWDYDFATESLMFVENVKQFMGGRLTVEQEISVRECANFVYTMQGRYFYVYRMAHPPAGVNLNITLRDAQCELFPVNLNCN